MLSRSRFLATLLAASSLAFSATPGANPFYGKWQLDKSKTKAQGAPEDLQCEIKQDGDHGLVIKSKYLEPKNALYPLLWVGIMTYELPLSADGTEKQNQIGPFVHLSKTQVDGNKMTTDWKATIENGSVEGQWIRTVSADGKQMDLQIIAKSSDGRKMDQTLVFKRR